MKKNILIILFGLMLTHGFAQSDIRLNNYWWKTSIINPASMDAEHLAEFDIAYRNQWTLFPGAPKTMYASGSYYIDDLHTKFGVKILKDQIGYTSSLDLDFIYSYATKISYYWRVQMGLALSYQNQSYDASKIITETITDPLLYERLLNENKFNSDVGFEFTNDVWLIGMSGQNIASLFRTEKTRFVNTNIIYAMYRKFDKPTVNLGYGVSAIQTKNLFQMEFNLTSYFKIDSRADALQFGLFYRTRNEMGVLFGTNLGQNLHLYYNYDYNVGGISRSSIGSHELMLTYSLDKIEKCNCWY